MHAFFCLSFPAFLLSFAGKITEVSLELRAREPDFLVLARGEQGNCCAALREGQRDGFCGLASSPPQHVPLGATLLLCLQALYFHSANDGGLLIGATGCPGIHSWQSPH